MKKSKATDEETPLVTPPKRNVIKKKKSKTPSSLENNLNLYLDVFKVSGFSDITSEIYSFRLSISQLARQYKKDLNVFSRYSENTNKVTKGDALLQKSLALLVTECAIRINSVFSKLHMFNIGSSGVDIFGQSNNMSLTNSDDSCRFGLSDFVTDDDQLSTIEIQRIFDDYGVICPFTISSILKKDYISISAALARDFAFVELSEGNENA